MPGRLSLLLTSPRVPAGVLTREGWQALETAQLRVGYPEQPQVEALQAAGLSVGRMPDVEPPELARALLAAATDGSGQSVVWVVSADGDPGLTDALADEVSHLEDPPEMELVLGSYDVPGGRLLDLVAVMDRLRSPDGCPWDAKQTHESLVPYLIEEAHEAAEAIEAGDRQDVIDELGDVLLQVAFHARIGEEDEESPWDIDDVAGAIVAKLVRRHPHVFGDVDAPTAEHVEANWEAIKAAEREAKAAGPDSSDEQGVLDGVPASMPSLARAVKVVSRLRRAGREDVLEQARRAAAEGDPGSRLLALVAALSEDGVDADAALRAALRSVGERV